MKRGLIILLIGLLAAVTAYGCIFFACTSPGRSLQRNDKPELSWLKDEFRLSDIEFKRVAALHAAYLPQCHEMCVRIHAQNSQLQVLLGGATNVTPEIEKALAEGSRLRAECQSMMLRHFLEVGQTMPPDQRKRYLEWVTSKAIIPHYEMKEKL